MPRGGERALRLEEGATVAIIGGGPAGAFAAIHLLRLARNRGLGIRVVVFEYRRRFAAGSAGGRGGDYTGCPRCAGGISPRLNDALEQLDLPIPADVVQAQISAITVQGNWKNIVLPVPGDRTMLTVYRGALPFGQHERHQCFDAWLLDAARDLGAELKPCRVHRIYYGDAGRPVLCYRQSESGEELQADLLIVSGGVNETGGRDHSEATPADLFQMLQPQYRPPPTRKAIIFELEATEHIRSARTGEMHFIESSSGLLHLDMCSIIPKRGYFTVSLIGKSVDRADDHKAVLRVVNDFLALPQIRRTLPAEARLRIRCICNPRIVVGIAAHPVASRAVVVGDMVTSRQYKDGILSAHTMARQLAAIIVKRGIDDHSMEAGFNTIVSRYRRDNRFAMVIFFLYRWFFTSPYLSRVIYQTYTSELKQKSSDARDFGSIFWRISSGDDSYENIAWSMLKPSTLWQILSGGVYVTLRNWLAERFFGLDWSGIGRFPTAVPREGLKLKRADFLKGRRSEFECIYTIHLRTDPDVARRLLGRFGEPDRPYLKPRWVAINRIRGQPLQPGSVINYRILGGLISFSIKQLAVTDDARIVYRVRNGFAHGGLFFFEVEPGTPGHCYVTIYLAFDYARGGTILSRIYWRLFRLFFPEFIHDVLWNHALCEFKQAAESVDLESEPELIDVKQL
jgi:flavin-dependent dehydrogenase